MASVQASKGSSDRTTPDLSTPQLPSATLPMQHPALEQAAAEQQQFRGGGGAFAAPTSTPSQPNQQPLQHSYAHEQVKYAYVPYDGATAHVEIAYDELRPSQLAYQVATAPQ